MTTQIILHSILVAVLIVDAILVVRNVYKLKKIMKKYDKD